MSDPAKVSKITTTDGVAHEINAATINEHTVAADVPSTAVFTDEKVTQTESATNANYEVTFSGTADNTTRTEGVGKSEYFKFNPNKKAFTFGTRYPNKTVGDYSVTMGEDAVASGKCSHAAGYNPYATGLCSHAEGNATTASGSNSHAEGNNTTASGESSHAEGRNTTASGEYSHAEGRNTRASGKNSHCEGGYSEASGDFSHSEGGTSFASGKCSHAEGDTTTASGYAAHSEGECTTANHKAQHVFGEYNIEDPSTAAATARGNYVEIVGNGTGSSAKSNARTLDWDGNEWLANGLTVGTADTVEERSFKYTQDQARLTITGGVKDQEVRMPSILLKTNASAISTTEQIQITSEDIEATPTWDGTNTALRGAISSLISRITWTYIAAATAPNTKITYAYGAKELYIEVPWAGVDYTYVYQFYILLDNGASGTQVYRVGSYAKSSQCGEAVIRVDKTNRQVWLSSIFYNGTARSDGGLKVWYR